MVTDIPAMAMCLLDRASCLGNSLDICWHAGEPLVLPVEYYAEALDQIERSKPHELNITHHFQTNGTLITDEFCRFAKSRQLSIGVSLDGPEDIHDKNRLTRGGYGTHNAVMQGVKKLQENAIPFSVISVLTASSLKMPDKLFEFFSNHQIQTLCFNLEQIEGIHKHTSLHGHDSRYDVKQFFIRYMELARQAKHRPWIREIDGRIGLLFGGMALTHAQNQPLGIVSVNYKGDISTFSPELLDATDPRIGNFIFGNVLQDPIDKILSGEKFQYVAEEIRKGVTACKETCGYFAVCGGGSPVAKLSENGTFACTETANCRLSIMAITDILLDHVEHALESRSEAGVQSFPVQL